MPEHDVDKIVRTYNKLEAERANWDWHWEEIARIVWPAADEFKGKWAKGEKRSVHVYDSTAALALEKFAAAMESMLTPRSATWHRLKATDPNLNEQPDVKEWFETLNRLLFQARNSAKAAYYSQAHEGYKSLGAFGNSCLFVDERLGGGIRYKNCHIGQIFVVEDHNRRIDTVYRKFKMTAKAFEQKWPKNVPPRVASALKEDPFREIQVLHVVAPNPKRDPERMDAGAMAFLSLYLSLDDRVIVEQGGYRELPYMYSRYTINPSETYGRGPAMLVLPSIKMLQEMAKTMVRMGHRVVDPPLLLANDGILGAGGSQRIRLRNGGLNYGGVSAQGKELIKPLFTGGRLEYGEAMMEKEREVVQEAFLVTLFQILVDQPNMTATEALIRAQEKGQLLAPTVGRQQSERLGPQIEREVNLLMRQNPWLEESMPEALVEAEGEYEIEYEGQAARLQRSEELVGIQRTLEIAAPFAQLDPGVLQVLKADEVIRLSAEINGVPQKVLRTPEEFEAIQAEQARQAQAAMAIEQMGQVATAGRDAAQAEAALPAGP